MPKPNSSDTQPVVVKVDSTSLLDLVKDWKVALIILAALVLVPGFSSAVMGRIAPPADSATVDSVILQRIEAMNTSLTEHTNEHSTDFEKLQKSQDELQVSINGDPTRGLPGIKGQLLDHKRKLDSLKRDVTATMAQDDERDKVTGLDRKLDKPLSKDPIWYP